MRALNEYKHLFFDLDDTLTASRSPMDPDATELYKSLPVDLIAVSGAETTQIGTQVGAIPFYRLGQNGNHALTPDGHMIWERRLTDNEKREILIHASMILGVADWQINDPGDLIEDRGSQIGFSLIGHREHLEKKRAFDSDGARRSEILRRIPFTSDHIDVKIGGTTCLDYFKKGHHKGSNIAALIDHLGWNKDDCVFFGDKLMPGGNDESVVGVIDTVPVANHRETYNLLRAAFSIPSDIMVRDKILAAIAE